jgi:putative PIN family toxin of toxin-antitoxin system
MPTSSRVVFDTSTVLSALLFAQGRLAWLRAHWRQKAVIPLVSRATADELLRVLAYPKFRLDCDDRLDLLGDYLPFCETVEVADSCPVQCRDPRDQPFLDLAVSGAADLLISSDGDLLALAGQTGFVIEAPESYHRRVESSLR